MPYRLATAQYRKKRTLANSPFHFQMGWLVGFEPTISRSTIWRVDQLRYSHHMVRPEGLEPPAHCLEGSCSIHLSYGRLVVVLTGHAA